MLEALQPYLLLFALVFAKDVGVPLPGAPVLLVVGALASAGWLGLAPAVSVAVGAVLLGDLIWYETGRRGGAGILGLLCRVTGASGSCVQRARGLADRYGVRSLLIAKFVPGLSAVAAPLAGASGMRLSRFLPLAGLGGLLWAGTYTGLGYAFGDRLVSLAASTLPVTRGLAIALLGSVLAYVALRWKTSLSS